MVWEYVVKSRKAEDYRQMLLNQLYHPPRIDVDREKSAGNLLYLVHRFEGKPLVQEYIPNTLLGIEFLWGGPVRLETSEAVRTMAAETGQGGEVEWRRVVYEMKERKISKTPLF
jgi:stage V sporulation protein R